MKGDVVDEDEAVSEAFCVQFGQVLGSVGFFYEPLKTIVLSQVLGSGYDLDKGKFHLARCGGDYQTYGRDPVIAWISFQSRGIV